MTATVAVAAFAPCAPLARRDGPDACTTRSRSAAGRTHVAAPARPRRPRRARCEFTPSRPGGRRCSALATRQTRGSRTRRQAGRGATLSWPARAPQLRGNTDAPRAAVKSPLTASAGSLDANAPARLLAHVRRIEELTRPPPPPASDGDAAPGDVAPRTERDAHLRARFDALPAHVRTRNQILGRITPGCEGTQGVFPRCNFTCRPCYHSADANRVRVNGTHTLVEVSRQMQTLREARGPYTHCQLIGGEVSLLPAEDHARALQTMHAFGRFPMSFTHGDFDYDYLRAMAIDPATGRRRFDRLDFAVHFDRFMVGRRGALRPESEAALHPHRQRFMQMCRRLQREHGVRHYVAHNMTVQPGNVDEIAETVRAAAAMGFRMMSFQPAAYMGNPARWTAGDMRDLGGRHEGTRTDDAGGDSVQHRPVVGGDERASAGSSDIGGEVEGEAAAAADVDDDDYGESVWRRIEAGAGARLPYSLFQIGDVRCNRTCWGAYVGASNRFVPFLTDESEEDIRVRDAFLAHFGSAVMPQRLLALKLLRCTVRHPWALPMAARWAARFVQRAGGVRNVLAHGIRPMTFVMHRFMDADDVREAWALLQRDGDMVAPSLAEAEAATAAAPTTTEEARRGDRTGAAERARAERRHRKLRETQERLLGCSYSMAHPDTGELVPACAQHSVYDPETNKRLADEMPAASGGARGTPQSTSAPTASASESPPCCG